MKTFDRMNFFAPGEIGATRRVTPEGFLVCEGVAIARTGIQLYKAEEIPLDADAAGEIRIERIPGEVFREETIASFEGKPVTVEHPPDFVTPENWEKFAVGTVQNVRRGSGINDDLLMADLVITKADAIAYVNRALPELSAGYESEYEQSQAGRGLQRNIIGNHVALVERGRAGPRVSIKDHQPGASSMKGKFFDRLVRLFTAIKANDEAAMGEIAKEIQDAEADPATGFETRLKQAEDWIKDRMAKDAAAEEEEKKRKEAEDAVLTAENDGKVTDLGKTYTGDELKEIFSRAEILAPGIAIPTGDALKAKDVAPALMLKALQTAEATESGKAAIKPFLLGKDLKALTGDTLLGVFNGAAELTRLTNNRAAQRTAPTRDFSKPGDIASINKANADFWAGR